MITITKSEPGVLEGVFWACQAAGKKDFYRPPLECLKIEQD